MQQTDRLGYFLLKLNRTSSEEILDKMSRMVELIHDSVFPYESQIHTDENPIEETEESKVSDQR